MEPRRRWPRESELVPFRLRTISINIKASILLLVLMLAYWLLSAGMVMPSHVYWSLWGVGVARAAIIALIPWKRILGSDRGLRALCVWSALDVVLISAVVGVLDRSLPEIFFLYVLTTFFIASCPLVHQIGLLAFTAVSYMFTLMLVGSDATPADITFRLGFLGIVGFVAAFVSHELMHQMNALRRSEDLFRAISDLTSDYAYSMKVEPDGSLSWEWVTGAYERVTGFTFEETLARGGWQALIHPDDLARAEDEYVKMMTSREKNVLELRLIRKSGDARWVRIYVQPIVEDGSIVRVNGAVEDITEAKEREEALARAHEERRRLVTHLVRAKEEERKRVASDIHDDTIQIMTSVAIDLERGARRIADPGQSHLFARLEDQVRGAIARLRAMVFELRPPALDEEGLLSALRLYLEELRVDTGIAYDLHIDIDVEPDPDRREILYRVAKEALTNVRKHSGAKHVDVHLEREDGGVLLRVADDGTGMRPQFDRNEPGHFGLSEMRERSEMLGGWFRVRSNDPTGTTIECWVPDETSVPVK